MACHSRGGAFPTNHSDAGVYNSGETPPSSLDDALDIVVEPVVQLFRTAFVRRRERFDRRANATAVETGQFDPPRLSRDQPLYRRSMNTEGSWFRLYPPLRSEYI